MYQNCCQPEAPSICADSINLPPLDELDGVVFAFITRRATIMPFAQRLSPEQLQTAELAGEEIVSVLTTAPGNGAPIGGLKVITEHGWFAARPSGTEEIYKIYAESFRDETHLQRIIDEAREIVQRVVQEVRDQFVQAVTDGRDNLDRAAVEALADGRIYTGQQAVDQMMGDSRR